MNALLEDDRIRERSLRANLSWKSGVRPAVDAGFEVFALEAE
ncbi:MAG: hypothetical protein OXI46_05275 [Gemmatimonadota bacterium]|nr:hypothetical protein [Gemmatimonadota bacterium]